MSACPWKRKWDDKQGQYYYYLGKERSQWSVPAGYEDYFASQPDEHGAALATSSGSTGGAAESAATATPAPVAATAAATEIAVPWRQAWQGDKPYYYRTLKGGTTQNTWEEPEEFIPAPRPAVSAGVAAAAAAPEQAAVTAAPASAAAAAVPAASVASPSPTAAAASPSPALVRAASPPSDALSPHLGSRQSPALGAGAGGSPADASPAYDSAERSPHYGQELAERGDTMDVDADAGGFAGGLASPDRSPTFDFNRSPVHDMGVDGAIAAAAVGRHALASPQEHAAAAGKAPNEAASAVKGKAKGPASAVIDVVVEKRRAAALEAAMAEIDAMAEYGKYGIIINDKEQERRDQDSVYRFNQYIVCQRRIATAEVADEAEKKAASARAARAALERAKELHVENFRGYAANAMQLCDWLQWAQKDEDEDTAAVEKEGDPAGPEAYEREINNYLRDQIAAKFADMDKVDAELLKIKGTPIDLVHMLNTSPYWRRFFLELYEKRPDSSLLTFVLRTISNRGHHNEIAAVVTEVPIFEVMDGVLRDMLSQVPAADSTTIAGLLPNLKRICCSGVYSFIYSYEVLRHLELRSIALGRADDSEEEMSEASGSGGGGDRKGAVAEEAIICSRKFRRLRQELVAHASGQAGFGDGGYRDTAASMAEAAALRRQGATARTVHFYTELHKRENARAQPRLVPLVLEVLENAGASSGRSSGTLSFNEAAALVQCFGLEALVLKVFEEPANGSNSVPATEAAAAVAAADADARQRGGVPWLRPPVDHLRNPVIIDLLMRTVFHQYSRSGSADSLRRCCVLLAYASCVDAANRENPRDGREAAQALSDANRVNGESSGTVQNDESVDMKEVALAAFALLEASEICVDARLVQQRDLQARLALAMNTPVVAVGVLVWVASLLRSADFVGTSNFITTAPLLIKLSLRAAELHPLQRPAAFAALKEMFAVNPSDVQARMRIKRQVLSGMLRLVASGYVVHVFDFITSRCEAGALDHSLIRHFVGLLLRFAKPLPNGQGYSPVFLEVMANLLGQKSCHDALLSLNFGGNDRILLRNFVGYCMSHQAAAMSPRCREVMSKLQHALMQDLSG